MHLSSRTLADVLQRSGRKPPGVLTNQHANCKTAGESVLGAMLAALGKHVLELHPPPVFCRVLQRVLQSTLQC